LDPYKNDQSFNNKFTRTRDKTTMEEATAIDAWNNYLDTFLKALCETFPECVEMMTLRDAVEAMLDEDEYSVMNKFLEEMEPHIDALTERNETAFFGANIDFLNQMGVQKYWTPDLEEETKDAIWNYLQQLYVMGKTIQSVPPETLKALERYAKQMTDQFEKDNLDESQIDLKSLSMGAMKAVFENNPNLAQQLNNADVTDRLSNPDAKNILETEEFTQMMQNLMGGGANNNANLPSMVWQNPGPFQGGQQQQQIAAPFQGGQQPPNVGQYQQMPPMFPGLFGQPPMQQNFANQPIPMFNPQQPQMPPMFIQQPNLQGGQGQGQLQGQFQGQGPVQQMVPPQNLYFPTQTTPPMWSPAYQPNVNQQWPQRK
jgi:hypothetical protein